MPRAVLFVTICLFVGCTSNPPTPNLPQPAEDVVETQPTVPPASEADIYLGGCGWLSESFKPRRMVFDLVLAQGRDFGGLTVETRNALTAGSGVVVFTFAANIVRLELDTVELANFVGSRESSLALAAKNVTDFADFEAHLIVEFARPISQSDMRAVTDLATEVYTDPNGTSLSVFAQNRVLPQLKALEGIKRVEARKVLCGIPDT